MPLPASANADLVADPYRRCEEGCKHDLAEGVLVAELLERDGVYPDDHPLLEGVRRRFLKTVPAMR